MTQPRLFLSDVDGTLLNADGRLSDATRAGLERLLAEGLLFSIASARAYFSLKQLFGGLALPIPIIEFNGAYITDFATGEHLVTNAVPRDTCLGVLEQAAARSLTPFVSAFDGEGDRLYFGSLQNESMQWYHRRRLAANDHRLRGVKDVRDALGGDVVGLTFMCRDAQALASLHTDLVATYHESLQLYFYENEYDTGSWWLTVHAPEASKHIAMRRLMRDYVPQARTVVAIGDNINDIEMLRSADWSVVVANAAPAAKAVASETIGHHDDDAVIRFLEGMWRARHAG